MPCAPVVADATRLPAYTLDDAVSDIGHLAQLLDAIVDIAVGLPRMAEQNVELDRLDAFVWIGRDQARRIARDLAEVSS